MFHLFVSVINCAVETTMLKAENGDRDDPRKKLRNYCSLERRKKGGERERSGSRRNIGNQLKVHRISADEGNTENHTLNISTQKRI